MQQVFDLAGVLAAADRAEPDDGLVDQSHAGGLVQLDASLVVGAGPTLQDGHERALACVGGP